jgi:hypothetical protein
MTDTCLQSPRPGRTRLAKPVTIATSHPDSPMSVVCPSASHFFAIHDSYNFDQFDEGDSCLPVVDTPYTPGHEDKYDDEDALSVASTSYSSDGLYRDCLGAAENALSPVTPHSETKPMTFPSASAPVISTKATLSVANPSAPLSPAVVVPPPTHFEFDYNYAFANHDEFIQHHHFSNYDLVVYDGHDMDSFFAAAAILVKFPHLNVICLRDVWGDGRSGFDDTRFRGLRVIALHVTLVVPYAKSIFGCAASTFFIGIEDYLPNGLETAHMLRENIFKSFKRDKHDALRVATSHVVVGEGSNVALYTWAICDEMLASPPTKPPHSFPYATMPLEKMTAEKRQQHDNLLDDIHTRGYDCLDTCIRAFSSAVASSSAAAPAHCADASVVASAGPATPAHGAEK